MCKGRNEQGGGLLKPVLLLGTSRVKRVGSGGSHLGSMVSQASVLPRRKGRCRDREQTAGEEVGYDSTGAARNVKLQAQQRYFHLLIFILKK